MDNPSQYRILVSPFVFIVNDAVILLNDLSFPSTDINNAAMALATVLATIPVLFF